MASVPEHADTVAKRRDVLAALSTPRTKPALVERLDSSRSTVDRAIDALSDHGYVEQQGSEYVATYAGRAAVDAYEQCLDRLTALADAQPVLRALPPTVDIPPAVLDGAQVVESTVESPQVPAEAATELGTGATELYAAGPSVIPHYIDEIDELVADDDSVELVLTADAYDVFATNYGDALTPFFAAENIDIYVTDEMPPYAIWLAEKPDETVSGIIVHTETGIRGVINNSTPAMNEWIREQHRQLKAGATLVG